ncbi:hypothetical protein [Streptomyces actinomycinicus]|uniref:hypothetical protein n=1 Tax=Streptomyces actinomycinicus TaxID=1695166 RepID=UPI003558337B
MPRPALAAVVKTSGDYVDVADLRGQRWLAGSASGEDGLMRVRPGLDERPEIVLTARDRPAKLHLVAAALLRSCARSRGPREEGVRGCSAGPEPCPGPLIG